MIMNPLFLDTRINSALLCAPPTSPHGLLYPLRGESKIASPHQLAMVSSAHLLAASTQGERVMCGDYIDESLVESQTAMPIKSDYDNGVWYKQFRKIKKTSNLILTVVLITLTASACGVKGDLVKPSEAREEAQLKSPNLRHHENQPL